MLFYKKNSEILEDLHEYVEGHIEAKKALIMLLDKSKRRNYQKYISLVSDEYLIKPQKILLMGPSGTGKTHLVDSLRKLVHFPLVKIDATKFNLTGGTSGIKAEDLERMILVEANRWVNLKNYQGAEYHSLQGAIGQTVVFVDEFDKLASHYDGSSSGKWNNNVQSNFLTLFDNKDEFSGVSFIFAGAFSGIEKQVKKKGNSIGFTNLAGNDNHSQEEIDLAEELVQYGLIPELVGRLTNIIRLDKFEEEHYHKILIERLLPAKKRDLASLNLLNIDFCHEKATAMSKKAFESGQGVRALQRELDKHFFDMEFDYEDSQQYQLGYGDDDDNIGEGEEGNERY